MVETLVPTPLVRMASRGEQLLRRWRRRFLRSPKEDRARMRSLDRQQVLRWVEELKEKQTKTASEEACKEEILQALEGC